MSVTLLECDLRIRGRGDFRYSVTFHIGGRVMRVRVCRDDDRRISFSVAELLDGLRWTSLVTAEAPAETDQEGGGTVAGRLEVFARDMAGAGYIALACAEETA